MNRHFIPRPQPGRLDPASIIDQFALRMMYSIARDENNATDRDAQQALAYAVRDRLMDRWFATQDSYYAQDVKRVYYLSLEFLPGRLLMSNIVNLGATGAYAEAMTKLGYALEDLAECEPDAGLGNGGLGRLAACFLDCAATLGLPFFGYGIRYEFGIFRQKIVGGEQTESPDPWLRYGNPWEVERADVLVPVKFRGRSECYEDADGRERWRWVDTEDVYAMAYDVAVPGYANDTVNSLRLWAARSSREFDLERFNAGDYAAAVDDKTRSESISKVLYPMDDRHAGRELRLRQQFFFVTATVHEEWDEAWPLCQRVFAYTNHTVLPEALESWSIDLLRDLLPRHLQIIEEIDHRFRRSLLGRTLDEQAVQRMAIIGEGWRRDLEQLRGLEPYADDAAFRERWHGVKLKRKEKLGAWLRRAHGIAIDPASLLDVQVKRMHEYKRQLLNLMHVIALYHRIVDGESIVPRTVVFGGKAAPGYVMAKLTVRLIHDVAAMVRGDTRCDGLLGVVFVPNYDVSAAELLFPATEISEQISTVGTEASGTGCMKAVMNGGVIVGTHDGANIEIGEAVGSENIFLFGHGSAGADLDRVIAQLAGWGRYQPIADAITGADRYEHRADFGPYVDTQRRAAETWTRNDDWTRMSILNTARSARFSADRTVAEYAREIWNVHPVVTRAPAADVRHEGGAID